MAKVLTFSVLVSLFCFNQVSAKPSESKKSSSSEENNFRYGVDLKQGLLGGTYTVFFQYDFSKYFGLRLGVGYGIDVQSEIDPKSKNILEDIIEKNKYFYYNFIPVQTSARIYPFGKDLCIAIGLELGMSPMDVYYEVGLKGKEQDIYSNTKNDRNENYLNSTQLRAFWSFDYTTSFGFLFGIDGSFGITEFINPAKNREIGRVGTFRLFVGLDFSKWFN